MTAIALAQLANTSRGYRALLLGPGAEDEVLRLAVDVGGCERRARLAARATPQLPLRHRLRARSNVKQEWLGSDGTLL